MSETTSQDEQRDKTEDEVQGDTYYIDGDFTVVGHLTACSKCGRKMLVEMALIGSQHHVGVTVVCGNCLVVTEEFRKEHPKIVSTIENWLHEGEKHEKLPLADQ